MSKDELLNFIYESENGVTYSEVTEKFGNEGFWKIIEELKRENLVYSEKKGNKTFYIAGSKKEENMSNTNLNLGNELQNILIDTIAKYSTDKVIDSVMPMVKQRVIDEFGVLPVTHEIKVGNSNAIKIKAELPMCFDSIVAYSVNGNPVMMTGPAGTGKGYLARTVAKSVGAKFFEVNAVKNSYELTGFVDANSRFITTPFYDACKTVAEGGKAVFLFDEMDCSEPEVLKIFNEALSSLEFTFPNNEHLEFEDLIILCACNTYGTGSDEKYCGEQLDASTLDRFAMVRVDYNRKVELAIAQGDFELVDFIDSFRAETEQMGYSIVISYRSIKRIVSMRGCLPLKQVMKECFVKSMEDDDLQSVLHNLEENFAENIYFKATKGENVKWEIKEQSIENVLNLEIA